MAGASKIIFFLYWKPGKLTDVQFLSGNLQSNAINSTQTSWKMITNLEKYGTNRKENVENHFEPYVNVVVETCVETR